MNPPDIPLANELDELIGWYANNADPEMIASGLIYGPAMAVIEFRANHPELSDADVRALIELCAQRDLETQGGAWRRYRPPDA